MVDASRSVQRQTQDLEYWLDFISKTIASWDQEGTFSSERVLMVVGSKIDLRNPEDILSTLQLETQYRDVIHRTDKHGKVFNKDWVRAVTISSTAIDTIAKLQVELFELARTVKANGSVYGPILRKASSLFSILQEKSRKEGVVVCKQAQVSEDMEALEYLHNTGEIAFLRESGWLCLDGPILERGVGLFIGPELHQEALGVSSRFTRAAILNKKVVLSRLQELLTTLDKKVEVIESILEVMTAIGICFESEVVKGGAGGEREVEIVFPSELGQCDNLVLPPSKHRDSKCHRWSINKLSEEMGRELFQKVLCGLWGLRCREYRAYINGILVIPTLAGLQQNDSSTSTDAARAKKNVVLVETKSVSVIVSSRRPEAIEEVTRIVLKCMGDPKDILIEKKEDTEKSPISGAIAGSPPLIPGRCISAQEVAALLLQSSPPPSPHYLSTSALPSTSPSSSASAASTSSLSSSAYLTSSSSAVTTTTTTKDFFGVVLTPGDFHPSLQREFDFVKRSLFEFMSRGFMDFDFELEKVVMVFNSQVESKFMNKMHQFLWDSRPAPEHQFEHPESDEWKRRQRCLKSLEDYVLRVPGSERTNLLLGWHGHERQFLYSNVVNGHYMPGPIAASTISELKGGKMRGRDFGYFGRGAYFSQSPQYVLRYLRESGKEFVLQLSWILPGRVYPVIEPIKGPTTLHGQPCVPGFDSHYVLTNKTSPVRLGEKPVGDELVVFSSEQVYPRYLVFLTRAQSIRTLFGEIEGTGFGVLPPGPVLIWVDDMRPDALEKIKAAQGRLPETRRVNLYHFSSTGEALSWIAKHLEPLRARAKLGQVRIATNSWRSAEVEVMAGKRLYQLIRGSPIFKEFNETPFLVYCGDQETSGFTEEDQKDRLLKITDKFQEAYKFGGETLSWVKDQPWLEWKVLEGRGLYIRVVGLTGLDAIQQRKWYYAVITQQQHSNESSSWRTLITKPGKWEWMSPRLSPDLEVRITIYRHRSMWNDNDLGFVIVRMTDIEKLKRSDGPEESEWPLTETDAQDREKGSGESRLKVKMRLRVLETDLGWF